MSRDDDDDVGRVISMICCKFFQLKSVMKLENVKWDPPQQELVKWAVHKSIC